MTRGHTGRQVFLAVLSVIAVAGACYPFSAAIGHRSVALFLLLTVSILAMRQGLAAVLTAALLSALIWDYFFIPPQFTLHIDSAEDALFMVMYFIVASLNGIINYRWRQLEQLRREKTDRENALKLYNTLFSSLSHDLRTPIAAVLGAADALQENNDRLSAENRRRLMAEITGGAVRLSEQVDNLLNVSRLESGMIQAKKDWCDVNDLLYSMLKKYQFDTTEHPVRIQVEEPCPLVQLDYGLTGQVLFNLVSNAIRHTPPGTEITLSASIEHVRSGHFELNRQHTDLAAIQDQACTHTLVIDVKDTGPGVPPEEVAHIFDKFYRPGNTKADGTGLGLFVVKGFTEAQGGDVSVRNLPDGGACFTLEIPTIVLNPTVHHD